MMRTYTGIVCEKKNKYMVFLTEKGEFLRGVPIGDPPEVGEEADFRLVTPTFIRGGRVKQRFVGAVMVATAVLFFILSSLSPLNEKVMAYVQLDAGTAMEFGVDRQGHVISLRYLNETAKESDHLSEWKGHSILAVLDRAVLESSATAKEMIITTIYPNSENERQTRQMIGEAVQEIRVKHEEINLDIAESTPEERKVANKKNMSIQQFKSTMYEKQPAREADSIKEKPIQKQKDELQKPKKEIFPPTHLQQKGMEKKRSNQSGEQQGPPVEKKEKKQNDHRSENVPPHADKKGPPDNPPGLNKQKKDNQGNPAKPDKDKPKNEKPENEEKNGSGSPS